jgi:hypothetical protein
MREVEAKSKLQPPQIRRRVSDVEFLYVEDRRANVGRMKLGDHWRLKWGKLAPVWQH